MRPSTVVWAVFDIAWQPEVHQLIRAVVRVRLDGLLAEPADHYAVGSVSVAGH